ncbi:ADP-ribosylation factor-like protein 5B [Myotis brandtii]|uniref:ADP-ribosylation factor-like protein 5B n=1 Tax=Myotis brandtii TaxID=109478 RepID=S7PLT7_MYOBR|nr:ADP-ribosylation factor-like protein 5B [Myotis brandtii]
MASLPAKRPAPPSPAYQSAAADCIYVTWGRVPELVGGASRAVGQGVGGGVKDRGFPEHKVIIVGLDNAGKTTILYQFLMNEVVHTSPTIGSNVEEIVVKNTHFLMWDIGGQESLRSSWNTYYSNTEFIILVVDSIDRERLAITKEELYRMLAHEDLRKAAVLIFANKQDMKGCMTAAEISKYLTLSSIKDHPWHIQSCCALTGEGLCQGLEWMTSRIGVR